MKPPASEQKLRGGYYTPPEIADFLCRWAIRSAQDDILEPSCGDGAFVDALINTLRSRAAGRNVPQGRICGIEFDTREAQKARTRLAKLGDSESIIHSGDFFTHCKRIGTKRFDAVVGNPPFIRYQNFPQEHRDAAFALMRTAGLKPNGLTNGWVPFVCISTTLLKDTGRLAMVIPSELLQVSYSAELRRFLSDSFERVTIFTFKQLLFKDAQQEVVLFCGERGSVDSKGIEVVELTNADELKDHQPRTLPPRSYKPMDHGTEKWTQYFLSKSEISLLRAVRNHERLTPLGKIASVDVGVVTGLNEFFVLTESDRSARQLASHTTPVVTRSNQLQGLVFGERDFKAHAQKDARAHMLRLPVCTFDELTKPAKAYVRQGEEKGFNLGFKCRTRKPWWVVPSPWKPDGFLLRQIHSHPKIIVNETTATCTDTIHRVRLLNGVRAPTLAVAFLNSLTFAFAEVFGRSYGGGVLELEPTEAEKLLIPLGGAEKLDIIELNNLVAGNRLEDALDETDRTLLQGALNLSAADAGAFRKIWRKLMERRHGRKVSPRSGN